MAHRFRNAKLSLVDPDTGEETVLRDSVDISFSENKDSVELELESEPIEITGTFTWCADCSRCGLEIRGATMKRMYARLAWHVWRRHPEAKIKLLASLWQLWRWKP